MITAWRLIEPKYAHDAFTGKGARLYGGRWNMRGTSIVYTASSISLATLELIVNVPRARRLPRYTLIPCSFDEALVRRLDRSQLPLNWRAYPAPPELRRLGEAWARSFDSAVLEVPSAAVPEESNYLLNPAHRDFKSIAIAQPRDFDFDLRLVS